MISSLRKLARPWAAVFILANVLNVLAPTISWALTSGPTAPEATSFEPVDTTDMVNLATGDFTYNVPLLEVPGPAGGYPLSLSYHGGIQPNEDASWVGLGWTLNPGAINRTVSGYADDFKNVAGVDRSFWEGGSTTTYSIGVSVGAAMGPNVSAGLTISDDTYKGFGIGGYVGAGYGFGIGPLGANVGTTVGISPYGNTYSSTGVSLGIGVTSKSGLGLGLSTGASIDQDGAVNSYVAGGLSYKKGEKGRTQSLLGSSLSSSAGGPSVSVGGGSVGIHNSNAGKISTSGYDYSLTIPVNGALSIHLGTSYQRYWTDETVTVLTNGSLYFPKTKLNEGDLDNKAFDSYDLMGKLQTKSDEQLNGSFVDYDHYGVSGQGISGSIKPYHYKSFLYRQNKKDQNGNYLVKGYPLGGNPNPVQFRFINDFSNRYTYSPPSFSGSNPLTYSFDSNENTGESGDDGYDAANNTLYGSKSVQWFTNYQISPPRNQETGELLESNSNIAQRSGFIDSKPKGFDRAYDSFTFDFNTSEVSFVAPADQIGGFKVTSPSGVSYHYALPVYAFEEYTYSGNKDEKGKDFFNRYKRKQKYAYTWLLTTVTGPDFYDRNQNGIADNGDYGYWVNFDYGKWTDQYNWRNPAEGYNKDVDLRYNNFSKGKKEIYFLNSIRTQTHTALFVKEIRNDAKGTVNLFNEAVQASEITTGGGGNFFTDLFGITTGSSTTRTVVIDEGGFSPKTVGGITRYPTSQLKLRKIYLVKNEDLAGFSDLESKSTVYNHSANSINYHLGYNVLDIHDVYSIENDLMNKSVKGIDFTV